MIFTVLVFPFVPPESGVGDTPPLPYYLYCLIGIAVMMFGVLYWAVWKLVLPYVFKFRLVPRKELLEDGTVVVLVSFLCCYRCSAMIMLTGIKFSREKVD
jgi:solute carrier family 7 (L-type amino acid transporter), member 9/15